MVGDIGDLKDGEGISGDFNSFCLLVCEGVEED